MASEQETEELAACPFCGGEAELGWHSSDCFVIRCAKCAIEGPCPARDTEAEAIAAWNTRTAAQPEREDVLEAINDWIYQSPPVGRQKVIIGCNFDDLADRILAALTTPAPTVSRDELERLHKSVSSRIDRLAAILSRLRGEGE